MNGIAITDATMDKELIEFCFGTPDELYAGDGQNKTMLRHPRTFLSLLPHQVLFNTNKGLQSSDIGIRMQQQITEIGELMDQHLKGHELENMIDSQKLSQSMDEVSEKASIPLKINSILKVLTHCVYSK